MDIIFATSNINKVREASNILGFKLRSSHVKLDEIQSVSVVEVAKHKAFQAYAVLKQPVVVEDTGLFINGLNGFPGPLVKLVIDRLGPGGLCRIVNCCSNRKAYADTCVAFCDGSLAKTFIGRTYGTIATKPKGEGGFGWDSVFIPNGHSKTFAEMTLEEKVSLSMRSMAFLKFERFLEGKKRI